MGNSDRRWNKMASDSEDFANRWYHIGDHGEHIPRVRWKLVYEPHENGLEISHLLADAEERCRSAGILLNPPSMKGYEFPNPLYIPSLQGTTIEDAFKTLDAYGYEVKVPAGLRV